MDIAWAFNGEIITPERSEFTVTKSKRVSLITIDSVTAKHAGEYTCTASNRAGATSHSAHLAVNGNSQKKALLIKAAETMVMIIDVVSFSYTCFSHST